jgi:GWxTD domain-containing protein
MKNIFFVIILLVFYYPVFGQVENSSKESPYAVNPGFYLEVANYKSTETAKTKVDIFLQIPYHTLKFIKDGESYKSKFSISIIFADEDKKTIFAEKLWNQEVKAANADEYLSKENFKYFYTSFNLAPGKYSLRCEIIDKGSNKNGLTEANINVSDFNDKLNLSDIILVKGMVDNQIVPNVSRLIAGSDSTFTFFYDIFSDTSKSVLINYSVLDKKQDEIFNTKDTLKINKDKNRIFKTLKNIKLALGEYVLVVKISDSKGEVTKSMVKRFFSNISGFPSSITDLDKAIDQLVYIAVGDEQSFIEDGKSYEEKLNRFKAFWKTKDPTPNTIENEVFNEYYRRISFSNEKFKTYMEGWKTDMGMVYILLGPPNNVERHPFEYDSKPYEIWEYYTLNRSFVFVDETGFGEYRLANRVFGDWFRYRQ